MVCAGCDTELPAMKNPGRQRKWCSDTCRAASYRPRRCKTCDKPLDRRADRYQRYCVDCQTPTKTCVNCNKPFIAQRGQKTSIGHLKTCSPTCAEARKRAAGKRAAQIRLAQGPWPCIDCETGEVGREDGRCPSCSKDRDRTRWRRQNSARRAWHAANNPGQHYDLPILSIQQLGDRDGWQCQLCFQSVDPNLRIPDRGAPTFDHIIPGVKGGSDAPSNQQLAHLSCNSRRGDMDLDEWFRLTGYRRP